MRKKIVLLSTLMFLIVFLFLSAVSFAQQKPLKKLKLGFDSPPSVLKIPLMVACEQAKNLGYEITTVFLPTSDLPMKGVLAGDLQLGNTGVIPLLTAMAAGPSFKAALGSSRDDYSIIAPRTIRDSKELDGKVVAYHAPFTQTEALVKSWAKKYNITPKWAIMPGSASRVEALRKGQIDATPASIVDFLTLDAKEPGKFYIIESIVEVQSRLLGQCLFSKPEWLEQNGDVLRDLIRLVLEFNRKAKAEPGYAAEQASKFLPGYDKDVIRKTIEEAGRRNIWDVNGALTKESASESMKFYLEAGVLKKEIPVDQWIYTKPLEDVLKEMGRK